MRVAVVGATGTAGAPIAAALESAGHEVRRLSRRSPDHPADLRTGAGLSAALEGCECVIEASNANSRGKAAREVLVDGNRTLLAAEAVAGVRHHVCLSIVGIERVPMAYYRVKLEQEAVVREGEVPWSIVRSTQFHQLLDWAFGSLARARVLPASQAPLQPVDPTEVADFVASVAGGAPRLGIATVAGPRAEPIADLARTWKRARDRRALLLPVPLLGEAGSGLRAGGLTDPAPEHRGTRSFDDWLASAQGHRSA